VGSARCKSHLHARHRIPWSWIVDPPARTIEVYGLAAAGYELAQRSAGDEPAALEPLTGLTLSSETLWV